MGLYFLWPLLSSAVLGYLVIAWMAGAVIDLSISERPSEWRLLLARTLILAAVGSAVVYWLVFGVVWATPKLSWMKGTTFVQKQSVTRPTLVYTSADWCIPCKEMDATTFRSPKVKRATRGVLLVKIDVTNTPPEPVADWISRKELKGVPTMVFLKPGGRELRELRAEGYLGAGEFSKRLQTLKDKASSNLKLLPSTRNTG